MYTKLLTGLLILGVSLLVRAEPPVVTPIDDQSVSKNSIFTFTPALENSSTAGSINWTKAYGPDDVNINAVTGSISWVLPSDIPSESFHIGIKASNGDGYYIESFIVHVGIDKLVYIGANETYTTMRQAFDKERAARTTFIIRNGTYSGEDNKIGMSSGGAEQLPPEGGPNNYTTVIAEDPGDVIFNNGALINIPGSSGPIGYFAFKGIFIDGGFIMITGENQCSAAGGCRPHHIKFIRNGVKGEDNTPFNAFRSDNILFENNYAFGGGRYKFASYQANNILWRRNVVRRDRSTVSGEPKGSYSVYTTMGALATNNLAIDGDQDRFATTGERSGEFACPTTSGPTRVIFERSIQLNSEFLVASADHQAGPCDGQYIDIVSWDVRPSKIYVKTRAASLFDHVTFGNIKPRLPTIVIFNAWPSDLARGVTNSVMHDFQGAANEPMFYGMSAENDVFVIDRSLDRYGIDTVNITNFSGNLIACCTDVLTNTITNIDPIYSKTNTQGGVRYLVRIENNSSLSGKAKDGSSLGATVMTFKGKSGTLYGEEGYDSETNIPMWPFPFEEKIKERVSQYTYTGPTYTGDEMNRTQLGTGTLIGARGFAVEGQSLTNYIWGYLGSTVPPFGVTATAGDKSALIKWNPHPAIDQETITEFKIYNYDPITGELSVPRTVNKTVFEYLVSGLEQGKEYYFAVTAMDSTKGESSYSYPIKVIPASKPNPLPPVLSSSDS